MDATSSFPLDYDDFYSLTRDFSAAAKTLYEERLFLGTTAEVAKDEILQIQHRQHELRELKDLTRLHQFVTYLDSLETALGNVFDQYEAGRSTVLMSPLWGSLKYLLTRIHDWDQGFAFDKLLESYGSNVDSLSLSAQSWNLLVLLETLPVLYNVYENVIGYQRLIVEIVQPKSWKNTFKAYWTHFTSELGDERRIIESWRADSEFLQQEQRNNNIHTHLWGSSSHQQQQLVAERVTAYRHSRKLRLDRVDEELNDKRAEQLREVFRWLAHDEYVKQTHSYLSEKTTESEDSGKWILRTPQMATWLETSTDQEWPEDEDRSLQASKIWMYGRKGAGKSVLAAFVTEQCSSSPYVSYRQEDNERTNPSVFYCQEDNERANSFLAVLRGLLAQILKRNNKLLSIYHQKKRKAQGADLQDATDARSLLKIVLDVMPRQSFIIDGLDECIPQEMQQILEFFRDLVSERDFEFPGALRVFISSTYLTDFRDHFGPCLELEVTEACINPDIKCWIETKVHGLAQPYDISPHIVRGIVDRILRRSDGMFLYAELAIKLLGQPSRNDLVAVASKDILPHGLEQAYAKMVKKLKREHQDVPGKWEKARVVLGWLTCARRPLRYHELSMILSFSQAQRGDPDMSGDMLRLKLDDLCGSLVQVTGEDRVKLIHPTARQYLTQIKESDDQQHLKTAELQFDLCVLCLRYLCLDIFTDADMPQYRREQRCLKGYFAFQDYAASKWHTHLEILVRDCWSVCPDPIREEALKNALDHFVLHYQPDLAVEPHAEFDEELLAPFWHYSFYEPLKTVWNYVFSRIKTPWEDRKHIGLAKLKAAVEQNRDQLELFSSGDRVSGSSRDTIERYYGSGRFKCDRIDCYRFYDGFDSHRAKTEHIRRHDRPFGCDLPGCSPLLNGFSSNKDLERHQRQYHPEAIEGPAHFVQPTRQGAGSSTTFRCDICGRSFTRYLSLLSHQRNHWGDRPFPCSLCGKRFARVNDSRRHERNRVCSSALSSSARGKGKGKGSQAGRFKCDDCDKTFAKRAQLNAHRRADHQGEEQPSHQGRGQSSRQAGGQSSHQGEERQAFQPMPDVVMLSGSRDTYED